MCKTEGSFHRYRLRSRGAHPRTNRGSYLARNVVLAFGSSIPNDLGIYSEARRVARKIENVKDHSGVTTLVIEGG